jgi:CMP-N,N'-diacetyllegionaminic acid synthase
MYKDKKILAIIPARGGSKGVPGKNLRKVQGVSLLARSIASAKASKFIDCVVVSSDDDAIITEALSAGAQVPFKRPEEFATDDAPGYLPVVHALESLPGYDYVIVLQVTSPLRDTADIDGALDFCLRKEANICVSVTAAPVSPHWMFTFNNDSELLPVLNEKPPLRRQDLPATYVLNGAIYIAATGWFLNHKSFLTAETLGYVMPAEKSLDLDTEFDFELLDLHLKNNQLFAEPTA